MKKTKYLLILLNREYKDLIRDKKTLFTTILLPLLMLPILGFIGVLMFTQQPVNIAVVDLDSTSCINEILNITVSSQWLSGNLTKILNRTGYRVFQENSIQVIEDPKIDLVVVIPRGFSMNASSLDNVAKVVVYRKAGYQSAQRAESDVYRVISAFSYNISRLKIDALTKLANVSASFSALRNPVEARTEVVTIVGKPVTAEYELRSIFARFLVIALSFVVAPASSYVIDGIIGERERKTIEFLLVSPAPLTHIIYAKMIMATFLGIIAAIADAMGLVGYLVTMSLALGGGLFVFIDYSLLAIHSVTAFFTILVTITIALPFITRTKGIRSASNIASLVTMLGVVFFFTGFFIDFVKLPQNVLTPLLIIPYVHSILVIQQYVLGNIIESIIHIVFLAVLSIALLIISTKTVDTEKLLIASS